MYQFISSSSAGTRESFSHAQRGTSRAWKYPVTISETRKETVMTSRFDPCGKLGVGGTAENTWL
jgi:hypothetical protein